MARQSLWLLLTAWLGGADAACVRINTQESSGWLGQDGKTKQFQLQVEVLGTWVSFTEIMFRWPGEKVHATNVWNADNIVGVGDDSSVIVRLGRDAISPPKFVVMGEGTQSITPHIQCNTGETTNVPPPSPPHATYCSLGPTYKTKRSWISNGKTPAGDDVQVDFQSWKDAGSVMLRYWGQPGLSIEKVVGAVVGGTTNQGADTVITLQLGTSCEDRVVNSDGIVVSRPGQQINCVPHRKETMHVTFNLHPPALHPPQISCLDQIPVADTTTHASSAQSGGGSVPITIGDGSVPVTIPTQQVPSGAQHGGWAPVDRPPPPPPPPPESVLEVGTSLRSMPDCALGATAFVTSVNKGPTSAEARIELRPDLWLRGYVFVLGITGKGLDLDPSLVEHASLLTPTVDVTGRVLLFGFALGSAPHHGPGEKAAMSLTIHGSGIELNQLSCRPAPAPPPYIAPKEEEHVAPVSSQQDDDVDFMFMEMSGTDIILVSVAFILTLALGRKHWSDLTSCCRRNDRLPLRTTELGSREGD